MCVCTLSRSSCVRLFVTPWTVAGQTLLSVGFFRQEHWSGLSFPPPGHLPWPRDQTHISCISCRMDSLSGCHRRSMERGKNIALIRIWKSWFQPSWLFRVQDFRGGGNCRRGGNAKRTRLWSEAWRCDWVVANFMIKPQWIRSCLLRMSKASGFLR